MKSSSIIILKIKNYETAKSQLPSERGLTRLEKRRLRNIKNGDELMKFFYLSYRYKILDFCGVEVKTHLDLEKECARLTFLDFNNGVFKGLESIPTKHPNILKAVIIGKKAWGLWLNEWSEGIAQWLFTLEEILEQFKSKNIIIPDNLLLDFKNRIQEKRYSCK